MKSISKNRKALHEYTIVEKVEAGIVLKGSKVKALRMGQANLADAYAVTRDGRAWLLNFSVSRLEHASYMNHAERRDKALLLHAKQIKKLDEATRQKGFTLIPLEIYFNDNNMVKIELALAKGKANHDKRQSAKDADAKREAQRAMRQ